MVCPLIEKFFALISNANNKGDNMGDLVQLLVYLKATIDSLQAQLIDAQSSLDVAIKQAYDKGYADGVASIPVSDKIYSQEEAQALIDAAVEPLNATIIGLTGQIEELKLKIDQSALEIDAKIQAAVDAAIAQVIADYESTQVDDSAFLAKYKK